MRKYLILNDPMHIMHKEFLNRTAQKNVSNSIGYKIILPVIAVNGVQGVGSSNLLAPTKKTQQPGISIHDSFPTRSSRFFMILSADHWGRING